MQMGSVFTVKWNAPCNIPSSIPEFARCAAKNWNGKRALRALERGQKPIFSSAKVAATFIQSKRNIY
jgi:hypothetical protein